MGILFGFGVGMIVVGFLYAMLNMANGMNSHSENFFTKHIAVMAVVFIGMVLAVIASGNYIYSLIERLAR